ncbi:ATP-binding cassette domain-containing protein [Streptomyces sp. AC627_RSS907]|uniref:ATP-binding cassette domain-containing protein n=1 Tax=Streptomyces sp. AC627_RSS907 TaxID=2823684 RepID=UPI001C2248DE|nr:ATP-binding cassette domain-containing protein [Streptomyces sp. AC627_RSS907]
MYVQLSALRQGYRARVILKDLNLALAPGVTGLVGPNGAGKTTLMRTLATVLPPAGGTIELDGTAITSERAARQARRHIGYLPQKFGWDAGMKVQDFVEYGAWLREVPKDRRREAVEKALLQVDLLERRNERMSRLSGGMRQRAGIAWAIVGDPGLVLLDEPTVGLDPRQRLQFRRILSELTDTTVLLSTHLIDDVAAACDRVIVLHSGSILFDGGAAEMEALGRDGFPGATQIERAYMELLPEEERHL